MNIYQALKEDHQEAKTLFAKLKGTTNRALKTRQTLFQKLKCALEAHSKAEEKVFYTALRKQNVAIEDLNHAKEEHEKAEKKLKELHKMEKGCDEWLSQLLDLKKSVEHHIKEEEADIFDEAKDVISKDEAQSLGEDFEKQKKQRIKKTA